MRRFLTKAYVMAATVALTVPVLESCVVSLPFLGNIVVAQGDDEEDLEDELDDLFDDWFD